MIQAALPPEPPQAAIVVTGTALPERTSERAYSVERLGRERLGNSATSQLDQLLKEAAGVQLFRRSDARSGHPTSQGVTLRALGGNASSRVLLLLDGVPQADPFGGWVNWPAYDPAELQDLQIVRGGGSVADGPGALGGTIEMQSRADRAMLAGVEFASHGTVEGGFGFGSPAAGGLLRVSARAARSDGFVPVTRGTRGPADRRAPYRRASARLRWVAPLAARTELQASLSGFTDRRERGVAFTGNRTDGADLSLRLIDRGRWQWSALLYGQWRELESSFANLSSGRIAATRVSLQDSVPSHAIGGAVEIRPPAGVLELRLGADARAAGGESRELFSYVAGEATRRRIAGGRSLTAGLFAEAALPLSPLTLSAGARFDSWRISDGRLRERVIASGAVLRDDRHDDRGGWLPTARAGAVLDAGSGVNLRSAAYLGWRMPTLNELFRPFRAGLDATAANAGLDPERIAGADAGLDFRGGGLSLSATLFVNRLSDAIANVTLGSGPGTFPGVGFIAAGGEYRQRGNIDAVTVKGIEAHGELRRGPWAISASASLAGARVRASGAAAALDGKRPAQTPRLALGAAAAWQRNRRSLSVALRRVGSQYEDDLNQRRLPPATTVDAFMGWPLTRQLQFVARGENLFDALVVAGVGSDEAIERATPRTVTIGIRLSEGR